MNDPFQQPILPQQMAAIKEELPLNQIPTHAGLYFARTREAMGWYNAIVSIEGEAPMLYVQCVWDRTEDKLYLKKPRDLYFGPEIVIPIVSEREIKR